MLRTIEFNLCRCNVLYTIFYLTQLIFVHFHWFYISLLWCRTLFDIYCVSLIPVTITVQWCSKLAYMNHWLCWHRRSPMILYLSGTHLSSTLDFRDLHQPITSVKQKRSQTQSALHHSSEHQVNSRLRRTPLSFIDNYIIILEQKGNLIQIAASSECRR